MVRVKEGVSLKKNKRYTAFGRRRGFRIFKTKRNVRDFWFLHIKSLEVTVLWVPCF